MDKVAIVLAAGIGKRMHSKLPKVLHKICGREMVLYPVNVAEKAGFNRIIAVISEKMNSDIFKNSVTVAYQKVPLGTGDAVRNGLDAVKDFSDNTDMLILTGDNPLIKTRDIERFYDFYKNGNIDAALLTGIAENPNGLGRVIKRDSKFDKIVEEKDATNEEKRIKEINTGIYIFKKGILAEGLKHLSNKNAQGEYYLTDVLYYLKENGFKVGVLQMDRTIPVYGVNNRMELSVATKIIQREIIDKLMIQGVTVINPDATSIDYGVEIGNDTVIYPGCVIEGKTHIGEGCIIGPNTKILDAAIGKDTSVQFSVVIGSKLGENCNIGPFSYVRPGNVFENRVKIGTFVEVKKSKVGNRSKIPHLSYIGDATVGKDVNIGAGTITCNFSGLEGPHKKNSTLIEDNVFIGSHNTLVAPVIIHKNAYTAAGSVINKEVPEWALAIGRAKQVNKEVWVKRRKENAKH